MDKMDNYEKDFESAMLEDTAAYYSRKAASWILEYSCPNYMFKVISKSGYWHANLYVNTC